MGASVDCEVIGPGLLGQPVNALSSLAFVAAGMWLWRRSDTRWIGLAMASTGAGSFLFHGPLAPGGVWIHDITLGWLLLVVLVEVCRWPAGVHLLGLGILALTFAALPGLADWLMAVVAVAIGILLLRTDRSRRTLIQLGLLAAVAVIGRLGATGAPLCAESSPFQTHALWHVGAAVVVTWWAASRWSGVAWSPERRTHPGA